MNGDGLDVRHGDHGKGSHDKRGGALRGGSNHSHPCEREGAGTRRLCEWLVGL